MYNQSGERCPVETAERISKLILQRNSWRRAFRVVRDEYRDLDDRHLVWVYAAGKRCNEMACIVLAHGLQVMCLLDRLDVARTFRVAEHTGRRS